MKEIDYSEIIGSDTELEYLCKLKKESDGDLFLAIGKNQVLCHIEITLKHPYTKKWEAMPSTLQKKFYREAWNEIKNTGGINNITDSGYVYEYHKSGHVHLHGYVSFSYTQKFSALGLIADYAKMYYILLPKICKYNSNFMFDQYQRYASPAVCIQYINNIEKPNRLKEWKEYMLKENNKINV